jgi:hypothetical protein
VKKVDWANRAYPASGGTPAFVIAKGKGTSDEYGLPHELGKVVYVDMNGNGSVEAFVPIQGPGGPRGGQYLTVFVYEVDSACVANEVYRIDGGPYANYGSLKGKSYVIERSGIGENGMPGELEVLSVTFKAGKYTETVTEPAPTSRR